MAEQFDAETELKIAEVRLGMQAEDFLKSPIGKYLLGRAADKADEALEKLKRVSPAETESVRALQNDVRLMESFGTWIRDAITNGNNAESQLKHQEDVGEG